MEYIEWTYPMFQRFKQVYEEALKTNPDKNSTFTFDGREFVVGYAKYLIEYLGSNNGFFLPPN